MPSTIDIQTCKDCINYRYGACAYRMASPDHATYRVGPLDIACGEFDVPHTRIDTQPETEFQTIEAISQAFERDYDGSPDLRRARQLQVLTVDDLRKLNINDQHYPVVAAQVQHNGESVIFYIANTDWREFTRPNAKRPHRRIPVQRYNVADLYQRIVERGTLSLSLWTRIKF